MQRGRYAPKVYVADLALTQEHASVIARGGISKDKKFVWPCVALAQGDQARAEIRTRLHDAQSCAVEVIMKDISTVRHNPRRLSDWARIAMEEPDRSA
ncbi:MAG: hypothetical protein J7M14_06365 [Planctomycetes bacterium]|nr:hypothetical protein [Planctomycetota bacterium]